MWPSVVIERCARGSTYSACYVLLLPNSLCSHSNTSAWFLYCTRITARGQPRGNAGSNIRLLFSFSRLSPPLAIVSSSRNIKGTLTSAFYQLSTVTTLQVRGVCVLFEKHKLVLRVVARQAMTRGTKISANTSLHIFAK